MYRTAEKEILDIRNQEVRGFLSKNYPAIMAERPVGMSGDYQFMPSYKIAETLIDRFNLGLVAVSQQFSRARDPRGQEHFMRFRLPETVGLNEVGDSVPELVIMNSHNGRSTLRAYAGIFRLVCSNGMVIAESSFGKMTMRHFGAENSFDALSKLLDHMAGNFKKVDSRMKALDNFLLSPHQQNSLANAMMKARKTPGWVEPGMILKARRSIEQVNELGQRSLWKTYNVLQESLAEARDVAFDGAGSRARSLRPLSGARAQILTNERLWGAMEQYIAENLPKLAEELGILGEVVDAEATTVVAEDQAEEQAAQESAILRGFNELMALSYEDMATVSQEEISSLSAEEKKKLSSRKSYLKKKEGL